jgi:multiple antibiotic resistance protein
VRNKDVMKQLPLGRYLRIIEWTIVVIFLALAGLVFLRLFSKGFSELLSLDPRQIINTSIQLFAIINPLSALPTFMVYTEDVDESSKKKIVNTTVLIVIALVLAFALFGQLILNALQITVESFMLGGGVLLMIIAIDMLGGTVRTKTVNLEQVAIVPLATPLLVGPGTMTTLIVLANTQRVINVLIGGITAAAAVFETLRYSDRLAALIGKQTHGHHPSSHSRQHDTRSANRLGHCKSLTCRSATNC